MYYAWCTSVLVAASAASAAPPPPPLAALRDALQLQLNELSAEHPQWALQLGWSSDEGSFGLAAGTVQEPQRRAAARPTTIYDKFLFGSGTKPLTSVAVLRLMEQGVLSLDDPVAQHVDKLLASKNGTSMTALFGEQAAEVTVGQLIRMQSGRARRRPSHPRQRFALAPACAHSSDGLPVPTPLMGRSAALARPPLLGRPCSAALASGSHPAQSPTSTRLSSTTRSCSTATSRGRRTPSCAPPPTRRRRCTLCRAA